MVKQPNWTQPTSAAVAIAPPSDFVAEKDKDSIWFANYSRWIVATFYNQPKQRFTNQDQNANLYQGIADQSIINWSYVFGDQPNFPYKYMTTDYSGNELPVPWIAGNKIGELYRHLRGTMLSSIENIEVTATNLSKDVASARADLYEKLLLQYQMKDILGQMMPEGVSFNPIHDPDAQLESIEDIEKYTESWEDKYSIIAEKLGANQMESDNLKEKFLQDGSNQIVSGLSSILTEVIDGMVTNTVIPDYEIIWDNRDNDPWNSNAYVCGYVKHQVPYQEIIRKFGDQMSQDDIEEIRMLAMSGYANMDEFLNYYNTGLGVANRFNWWNQTGTSNMTICYATVYFIAPRDWRYRKGKNLYGSERVMKINDNEEYTKGDEKVKGVDMPGDFAGWDLHQATLIGNKYMVNFGYANNVLRQQNAKGKPILPMSTFCSDMTLNQGKSIVQMMIPDQNELDSYAYKIREKVANDWGKNYIFNGNKFDGQVSTEIANNLKTLHVHVSSGGSGEPDDPQNAQRMVESVDMTLDNNIIRYIELCNMVEARMERTASVSRLALGQQTAVTGKGVQQQTIEQNSYGTMALMWGIMKHFNKVVQYNVNLKQFLYQFQDSVDESLTIGDEGSYLLKILNPREFGTQPLKVFLNIQSTLDPAQRAELKSIALSEAQNGKLDTVDYIDNILIAKTLNQAAKGMRYAKNKQIKEMEKQAQGAAQAQMQHDADLQHAAAVQEAALIQLKEDNANYRKEIEVLSKEKMALMQKLEQAPPPSPLSADLQQAGMSGQTV